MELKTLIFVVVLILIIAVFALFPEARALLSGFTRLFIKDMATTPEGAEAIYTEKIDEAQEAYNKADNVLKTQSGRLSNAKKELSGLKNKLTKIESDCESFVKVGNMEMAALKAEEREEVLSSISRYTELVKTYEAAVKNASDIHAMCENNLRKLKREKKEIVENMKMKQDMQAAYDDLDELKNSTGTDKLIDSIREKNKDLDALAEGSRVVHESRISTKLQKADNEAKKIQQNAYLESLKKKYNK